MAGGSSQSNYTRKRNKQQQIGKEKIKLSPFADGTILYRENIYSIVKIAILSKLTYRIIQTLSKFQLLFFRRNGKADPEIHIDMQGSRIARTISKKIKLEGSHVSILKLITKLQ